MNKYIIKDNFGQPMEILGEFIEEVTHGYNLKSGAWALYPDKDGTSTDAVFIILRPYRKRRHVRINKNRIISTT